jgi:DNA polymerase (family X)
VFAAVHLPWIPPELREDRGEIEAAEEGRLPVLVEAGDLRGDLHLVADGDPTALIEAARERGWAWVGLAGSLERARPAGLRVLSVAEVDLGRGPEAEPAAEVVIARATGPESPARRTERLVQAIGAGRVQVVVLGDCAIEPIARAAKQAGCALEVAPDGPEESTIRAAVEAEVRLALTSRARTPAELDRIGLSLARARRGWASAADVIDTRWLPAPRRRD